MNKRKLAYSIQALVSIALAGTIGLSYGLPATDHVLRGDKYLPAYKQSQYYDLEVGSRLADAEQYEEAITYFQKAVDKEPTNIMAQYNLGYALMAAAVESSIPAQQRKMLSDAERAFLRVRDLNPTLTLTYFKLGKLAVMREDYHDAADYYLSGVENNPDNFILLFNLANAYEKTEELDKALAAYQAAVELNPKFVYAHNNLGLLYEKLGEAEKAEAVYLEALAQVPSYSYARLNLANMYQSQDRLGEAEAMYKQTIAYDPENEWAFLYLGNTYFRQGEYESAVSAYETAIALNPEYPTTHYLVSLALQKLNRLDEALAHSLQYINLAPDGAFSKEAASLVMNLQQAKMQAKK